MHALIQESAQFLAAGGATVGMTLAALVAFAMVLAVAGEPLVGWRSA